MRSQRQHFRVRIGGGGGSDLLLWQGLTLTLTVGVKRSQGSRVFLDAFLTLKIAIVHGSRHDLRGQPTNLRIVVATSAARAGVVLIGIGVGVLVVVLVGELIGETIGVRVVVLVDRRRAAANTVRCKSTKIFRSKNSYLEGRIRL